MSNNAAAWRLIFADKPRYGPSYRPRNLPNAPADFELNDEPEYVYPTSPYSTNSSWAPNNNRAKNGNKRYTVAMVQSEKPLTNSQHVKLLNRLKNVTAV